MKRRAGASSCPSLHSAPTVTGSEFRTERPGEARFLASLSAADRAVRERLIQVSDAFIRPHGVDEVQRGEVFEILQLLQARTPHLGKTEVQRGEVLEILQLLQARIRHLGAA